MNRPNFIRDSPSAFTLVELLTATAVSTLILALLLSMFSKSTDTFARGQASADVFAEARASLDFLKRDLEGVIGSREIDYSHFPIDATTASLVPHAVHVAASNNSTAHPLAKRHFVPFEVNRVLGVTYDQNDLPTHSTPGSSVPTKKAFANAVSNADGTDYDPNFSALAFVTQTPRARQVQTDLDRGSDYAGTSFRADRGSKNWGDVCLAGYYVAYTYDSPIPGARATMKLHRHFRDSGSVFAGDGGSATLKDNSQFAWLRQFDPSTKPVQSRAHILIIKFGRISKPLYEKGVYDNDRLPFLLKPVTPFGSFSGNLPIIEPFPAHPSPPTPDDTGPDYTATSLEAVPPPECYGVRDHWNQTDIYYPIADEPIAFNVVRFRVSPMKFRNSWMQVDSKIILDAADVNQVLADFNAECSDPNEWPVIITPDLVDVELMVIDDQTASMFQTKGDWENWQTIPHLTELVRRNSKTFRTRMQVRSAQWSTL